MLAHTGSRIPVPPSLVAVGAIAGGAVVGAAMTYSVQLGVGVAVSLVLAPLVLLDLRIGLILWIPTTSLIAVAALDVGPNLIGMLILFGWLGALATHRSQLGTKLLENRRLLVLVGALMLWVVLSIAWKQRSTPPVEFVVNWVVVGAIMLVVPTILTDRRHLRLAAGAVMVGVVLSVALGFLGGKLEVTSNRLTGGSGDPNFLAAGCVPAILLAVGLAAGSARRAVRWSVVAAVALVTTGLAATASRGGLLAAIIAAVAAVLLIRHGRRWVLGLVLCVAGVATASFRINPAAWERVSDFKESTGREELWRVAWEMWQDHPVIGVGLRGFFDNLENYVRQVGPLNFAEFIAEEPHYVHNNYLELLAETGVVGLALYVAVVVASVRCAWRASQRFEQLGDLAMATLSRALIVSVMAMMTAGFFISSTTDRRTWVLLALGPALLAASRRQAMTVRAGAPSRREGHGRTRGSRAPARGRRSAARPYRSRSLPR
jgi:O-antigen ligase